MKAKIRTLRNRFYKKKGGPRGWGNRCSEYCAGCIVCESYKFKDEHGYFPSFDVIHPISQEAGRVEHEAWLLTDAGKEWEARIAANRAKAQKAKNKE